MFRIWPSLYIMGFYRGGKKKYEYKIPKNDKKREVLKSVTSKLPCLIELCSRK